MLQTKLPSDPATPLLGTSQKAGKSGYHKDRCMFIADPVTVAGNGTSHDVHHPMNVVLRDNRFFFRGKENVIHGAGETQQVKVPATRPDRPCSVTRTHGVEEEN